MDKIDKIRKEIERLKSTNPSEYNYQNAEGYIWALDDLLSFLDTLSEEPDKSLEEAVRNNADSTVVDTRIEYCGATEDVYFYTKLLDAFIAGAKWKEAQMMKNAKDGWVDEECVIVLNDGTRIDLQPDYEKEPAFEFEYAQDVHVIILPKED